VVTVHKNSLFTFWSLTSEENREFKTNMKENYSYGCYMDDGHR